MTDRTADARSGDAPFRSLYLPTFQAHVPPRRATHTWCSEPTIVWVLPAPDWPYAKMHRLYPSITDVTTPFLQDPLRRGGGGGSIPWLFASCSKGDANETPLVHLSSFFVFPPFSDALTSTLPFHLRHRRLSKFFFGAQWGRGLEKNLPNGWLAPINTLQGSSSRKALDSSNGPTSAKISLWVAVSLKTCSVHRDPRSSGH